MIVVTGATGHVGGHIVRTLRALGLPVRTIVRKGSEYFWLNDTGCEFFFGDLRDPLSLRRSLTGAEYLISATNIVRETQANNHRDVTVEGHRALFEAARERGVRRAVHISCMGVEQSAPAFQARAGAEDALRESGLEYTILRACIHEKPFLELAYTIADKGSVTLPGTGENMLSVLPAMDLAKLAAACLDAPEVANSVLRVGGPSPITARAALELACEVIGVPPTIRTLPSPVVRVGSRIGKPFRRFANRLAEQSVWFSEELCVSEGETLDAHGLPQTDLRAAMQSTAEVMDILRDPEAREANMVHPQFYATVYEPGTARLADLPDGPPPRKD
jgi:uncharacterized protein YbjT (DUF2867 family)